jgi:hypothetical protein
MTAPCGPAPLTFIGLKGNEDRPRLGRVPTTEFCTASHRHVLHRGTLRTQRSACTSSAFCMIVIDQFKDVQSQGLGPSNNVPPPPTFEESADHLILDFAPQSQNAPGMEQAPPEFTPYKADFVKLKNGWIISHDPHLNQDGPSCLLPFTLTPLLILLMQEKLCIAFCCRRPHRLPRISCTV